MSENDYLKEGETNDCVVRAVSAAFGVNYNKAHNFCRIKLNREKYCGTWIQLRLPHIQQAFGKKIKQLGKKGNYGTKVLTRTQNSKITIWSEKKKKFCKCKRKIQVSYKVKDFIKIFSEGNYLITVKGHAFAIVDGEIMGDPRDSIRLTRSVYSAYKIN